MTDKKTIEILRRALKMACKFMRNNPPGDLSEYPDKIISFALAGGDNDPEGDKYVAYFLAKALELEIMG